MEPPYITCTGRGLVFRLARIRRLHFNARGDGDQLALTGDPSVSTDETPKTPSHQEPAPPRAQQGPSSRGESNYPDEVIGG